MIGIFLSELNELLTLDKVASNCIGFAEPNTQRKWIYAQGRHVTQTDWANGLAFYAKNGDTRITPFNSNRARKLYSIINIPLSLYVVVKDEDADAVMMYILKGFSKVAQFQQTRFRFGASSVKAELESVADGNAVWAQLADREKPINYSAVRANFVVTITGDANCYADFLCNGLGNRIEAITTEGGTPITTENDQIITP